MGGKFKFQVQDSDLEYLFWRFDRHIALSEKKLPLVRPWKNAQNNKYTLSVASSRIQSKIIGGVQWSFILIGKKMRIFYPSYLNVETLPVFCFSVGQIALPQAVSSENCHRMFASAEIGYLAFVYNEEKRNVRNNAIMLFLDSRSRLSTPRIL